MISPLNNRFNNQRRRRSRWWLGGLVLLVLLWLISLGGGWAWGAAAASPFWYVGERIAAGGHGIWQWWRGQETLVAENDALRAELLLANGQLARLNLLLAENQKLRAAAGLSASRSQSTLVHLLVGLEQNPLETVLVDAGANNLVPPPVAGDLVGWGSSIALGQVMEVAATVSKVQLWSAPGLETAATLGPEATPVTLRGRGLGNFTAELPRGVAVQVGDQALLAGQPDDWLLAEVGSIERADNETMQTVFLRVPVNLTELRYVEIYHH